jgi:hypothetical protein
MIKTRRPKYATYTAESAAMAICGAVLAAEGLVTL